MFEEIVPSLVSDIKKKSCKFVFATILLAIAFLVIPMDSASAALKLKIVNNSGFTIVQMFYKESSARKWSPEMLKGTVIHDGKTYTLNFTSNNPPRVIDVYFYLQGLKKRYKYNFDLHKYDTLYVN